MFDPVLDAAARAAKAARAEQQRLAAEADAEPAASEENGVHDAGVEADDEAAVPAVEDAAATSSIASSSAEP